jgi:outer membrane lipoprotein carrier protein
MLILSSLYIAFSQSFDDFAKRLENIKTAKVSFTQKVYYPWQSKPDISRGTFYAQRGGKFRIEYEHPERTLIVSDGLQVMVYSPSDRSAILERLEKNSSPVVEALFLLSRSIQEVFDLVGEIQKERGKVLILKPKVKDEYFTRLYVEVSSSGDIESIKVEDKGGITTVIEFVNFSYNFTPSENLFKIKLPEGTRVIRQ